MKGNSKSEQMAHLIIEVPLMKPSILAKWRKEIDLSYYDFSNNFKVGEKRIFQYFYCVKYNLNSLLHEEE